MDRMDLPAILIVSFPEAVLVAALGLALVGVRAGWRELALIGALQAGAAYLVRLAPVPFGLHSLVLAGVFIIILHLVLQLHWRIAAVAGLLGLTIYVALETAISPVLLYLTGYPLVHVVETPALRFFFFLPEALLLGLLTWLCRRYNFKLIGPPPGVLVDEQEWQTLNRSYYAVYLLAVLPVMLLGTLNMAFLASRTGAFPETYMAGFLAVMALAVLSLAAALPLKIQKTGRVIARASTARQAVRDLNHIGKLLQLVRRQHHDFHHQLQTVYGLLETGCYKEARQYIRKTHAAVRIPLELIRTDVPHVTALLYTKAAMAKERQIHLDVAIECSLKNLPPSPPETGALLGNLLDNAFDAVREAVPENRVVRVEIEREPRRYIIRVANRGRMNPAHQSRLFGAGYSTKKGHAGLGLTSVRDIAEQYGGTVDISTGDNETVCTVIIPQTKAPYRRKAADDPE